MMLECEYKEWMKSSGYSDMNDWNYQKIAQFNYFFIKHTKLEKYALIKEFRAKAGTGAPNRYEVLIEGWVDYNGWAKDD